MPDRDESVVVFGLEDFMHDSSCGGKGLSLSWFPGHEAPQKRLSIDFQEITLPEEEIYFQDMKKKGVGHCLSFQASACADALLRAAGFEGNKKAKRYLTTAIWAMVNPRVFYSAKSWDKTDRFLFFLGDNSNDILCFDEGKVVVVAGTTVALPFDKAGQAFYVPGIDEKRLRQLAEGSACESVEPFSGAKQLEFHFWTKQEPVIAFPPRTLREPLSWPAIADDAKKALFMEIPPNVAAWCLEQHEGGRRYLSLSPASLDRERGVRSENEQTMGQFRKAAEDACSAKWGSVIPQEDIEYMFSVESKRMNIHHNEVVSWGGANASRTYISVDFHNYIHQDFDRTQRRVCQKLDKFGFEVKSSHLPSVADRLQEFLIENREASEELNRIPNAKVDEDGTVSLAILWPGEIYCIPSLMLFEMHHGSIGGAQVADRPREEKRDAKTDGSSLVMS